jgi:hypothetical protein
MPNGQNAFYHKIYHSVENSLKGLQKDTKVWIFGIYLKETIWQSKLTNM